MIIKSPIYPRFLRRENSLLCSFNYSWRESARREEEVGGDIEYCDRQGQARLDI